MRNKCQAQQPARGALSSTVRPHPVPIETWTAGPEYDETTRSRLRAVIESLGYKPKKQWWGVGGSQEIFHVELAGPAGRIEVEAETYVGLTVRGDSKAIAEIRTEMGSVAGLRPNTSLERSRER